MPEPFKPEHLSLKTLPIKGFRLVLLGLYPCVLGSFQGNLGDDIGSYKGYIRAILGKHFRGTTLGGTTQEPLNLESQQPILVAYPKALRTDFWLFGPQDPTLNGFLVYFEP